MLNDFMPKYHLRQIDRVRVRFSPEEAWPIVRNFDTYDLPISKFLFNLRVLPERIIKRLQGKTVETVKHSRIDDFTGPQKGFQILEDSPGREVVIGSVGKFWKANIEYARVSRNQFAAFNDPGFGKLVWNLRLDPDSQGGSWLTWELRVTATDEASWRSFKKYWMLIGNFSHSLRRLGLKRFKNQLGGSPGDEELKVPGDSFLPNPRFQKTMSKMIEVPPDKLWPWLVQMGCQRAGWYSIDRLDNGGIQSATKIIPELQNIKVGDILPWRPQGKEGFAVLSVDKNRSLILGSENLLKKSGSYFDTKNPIVDSWAFFLEPVGPNATYLITRVRGDVVAGKNKAFSRMFLGVAHSIMETSQLKNLKQRAEEF